MENILCSLLWCAAVWSVFALIVRHDRSRYRNCFLLSLATVITAPALIGIVFGSYSSQAALVVILLLALVVLCVPVLLVANGVLMIRREGHGAANLLSLVLGIVVGIGELSGIAAVLSVTQNGGGFAISTYQVLFAVMVSVCYGSMSFVSFMVYTLFLGLIPPRRDFDFVIVHGSGLIGGSVPRLLADRLDKAIRIYKKDSTPPMVITSGGRGADEARSEASAMAEYLVDHGIPAERILLEDQSTTTLENLRNSKAIIDSMPGRHLTALVTSNYHVFRCIRYARDIGLECTGIGARVAPYYWPSALIREFVAIHRERKHLVLFIAGWVILMLPLVLGL